jgi:hypothetical protein
MTSTPGIVNVPIAKFPEFLIYDTRRQARPSRRGCVPYQVGAIHAVMSKIQPNTAMPITMTAARITSFAEAAQARSLLAAITTP